MSQPEILIDAQALKDNFSVLSSHFSSQALMPVLKANAYGHGSILVAKLLEKNFPTHQLPYFCLAHVSEARILENENIQRPLLILSHFSKSELNEADNKRIEVALSHKGDVEIVISLKEKIAGVHLHLNSGMNRLGFRIQKLSEFEKTLEPCLEKLKKKEIPIRGVMTHFACAEEEDEQVSSDQVKQFSKALNVMKKLFHKHQIPFPRWIHLANSSALPRSSLLSQSNAARPGLFLYGIYSNLHEKRKYEKSFPSLSLKPCLSLRAPIRQVFKVHKGEGIGYEHSFQAKEEMLLASIPLGYADGIRRSLSRKKKEEPYNCAFWLNQHKLPIVGVVSMDLCMVDLSFYPDPEIFNREKVLWVYWIHPQKQRPESIAEAYTSISYEVLSNLGRRLSRRLVSSFSSLKDFSS